MVARTQPILELSRLRVTVEDEEILKGVDMSFDAGKIYAVLGPNASGKSTLARTIVGLPEYRVTQGDIRVDGKSVVGRNITERARMGIAYAFQHPPRIPGIRLEDFVCRICAGTECTDPQARTVGIVDSCRVDLVQGFERLGIANLRGRDLNDGFSGGEEKRSELFQVLSMRPRIMILDEPDSGLDYDSLKLVGRELKLMRDQGATTMIIISHSRYILEYLHADRIDILRQGRKVYSGTMELLPELADLGYEGFLAKHGK